MMVPRAFARTSTPNWWSKDIDEKGFTRRGSTRPDQTSRPRKPSQPQNTTQTVSEPAVNIPSTPVQIPSQRTKCHIPAPVQQPARNIQNTVSHREAPNSRESIQDLLSATAIPVRKRPKGRVIQRLPKGDYVADFSKLLLEDVTTKSPELLSSSLGNPQFDGLFGIIDELVEGQMCVSSVGIDATILSARSVSSESMPSLASPDDFISSDAGSLPLSFKKSLFERRLRQLTSSEDCGENHPLLHTTEGSDASNASLPDLASPTVTRLKRRPIPPKSTPGSFISTLSASLRALKSAAHTVSNIATTPTAMQPDAFFAIQPALTDDKRPPPSSEPPSPALRRYLNPLPPDSPAHLHFWHDERPSPAASQNYKPKIKRKSKKGGEGKDKLPPIVPLQSCIPPAVRTAHASSPPIWLALDGTPSNKNTAHINTTFSSEGIPRQREPRENRDFLRVLVAEMNMRRAGKLDEEKDDAIRKAVLWLPPVKEDAGAAAKRRSGVERWGSGYGDDD